MQAQDGGVRVPVAVRWCAKERRLCPGCVKPPELAQLADGDGAPSDGEGDGDGSSDEDLDGVVITHLSDDDDAGAEA